jgi:ParB family chromosome partitioning protein
MSTATADAPATAQTELRSTEGKPNETDAARVLRRVILKDVLPGRNPRVILKDIDELAKSIAAVGLIQPLLLRPKGNRFELVCGSRRLAALRQLKYDWTEAAVAELSDAEVSEAQAIENDQRQDVTPMEQARSYAGMIKAGGRSVASIATKMGRSESYIAQRLHLTRLIDKLQKLVDEGKLALAPAMLLARMPVGQQEKYFKESISYSIQRGDVIGAAEVTDYFDRHCANDLGAAAFPKDDPKLLPAAGSCTTCPKHSGADRALFADLPGDQDICTDAACFASKREAFVQLQVKKLAGDAKGKASKSGGAVMVTEQYYTREKGRLTRDHFEELKSGAAKSLENKSGKTTTKDGREIKQAVIADGERAGQIITVAIGKQAVTSSGTDNSYAKRAAKERKAREMEYRIRQSMRTAIVAASAAGKPDDPAAIARVVALEFWDRLEGDTRKQFAQLHELKKKRKDDYGFENREGWRLIEAADGAGLRHLIIDFCLIRHLRPNNYGDGKFPRAFTELAKAFKVDLDKIRATARRELTVKKKPVAPDTKSTKETKSTKKAAKGATTATTAKTAKK